MATVPAPHSKCIGTPFLLFKYFRCAIKYTARKTKTKSQQHPKGCPGGCLHPSADRTSFASLTSEFGWDRVYSTKYGRWRSALPKSKHHSNFRKVTKRIIKKSPKKLKRTNVTISCRPWKCRVHRHKYTRQRYSAQRASSSCPKSARCCPIRQ